MEDVKTNTTTPTALLTDEIKTQSYSPLNPYPTGWYGVLRGTTLKPGQVMPLHYFGRELVAFRGQDKQVRIFNAFCPHYGAHMGYQSRVVDNDIECPFHGWRFGEGGKCTHAHFSDKAPNVGVRSWEVLEKNEIVYVYYHPEHEASSFDLPEVPEFNKKPPKGWKSNPFLIENKYKTHIQELRENVVDEAHFSFIHKQERPPVQTLEFDGPYGKMTQTLMAMGKEIQFEADMYGPGVMVARTYGAIESCSLALTNPVDEHTSEMKFFGTVKNPDWFPVINSIVGAISKEVYKYRAGKEVPMEEVIWENKTYIERPVFLQYEKGIRKLRKWYQQFYV